MSQKCSRACSRSKKKQIRFFPMIKKQPITDSFKILTSKHSFDSKRLKPIYFRSSS